MLQGSLPLGGAAMQPYCFYSCTFLVGYIFVCFVRFIFIFLPRENEDDALRQIHTRFRIIVHFQDFPFIFCLLLNNLLLVRL